MVETGHRTGGPGQGERAVLVGVLFPGTAVAAQDPLDELELLADTAGARAVTSDHSRLTAETRYWSTKPHSRLISV